MTSGIQTSWNPGRRDGRLLDYPALGGALTEVASGRNYLELF